MGEPLSPGVMLGRPGATRCWARWARTLVFFFLPFRLYFTFPFHSLYFDARYFIFLPRTSTNCVYLIQRCAKRVYFAHSLRQYYKDPGLIDASSDQVDRQERIQPRLDT